jgi:GTP-binding protein
MSNAGETRVLEASYVASATSADGLPAPALPEVAFAGRSNVGKSSLLNTMMQRRGLARTSSTPGCTRQLNVFRVRCAGDVELSFVDLPGYGFAKRSKSERSKWGPMLEGYLRERITLRAVVLIVDVRRGLEDDDRQLLDFLKEPRPIDPPTPVPVVLVATKIDKLGRAARKPALDAVRRACGCSVIGFSATTGEGREELWPRLRALATKEQVG